MKGVDSCERCGDRLPFKGNMGTDIIEGKTIIRVETHPDTNNNMVKTTELYHPKCYAEKVKEEIRAEVEDEIREEIREELKEQQEEKSLDEL